MTEGQYAIIKKKSIAAGVYDITLYAPDIAAQADPGQFVMVSCDGFTLRRPISICGASEKRGHLRLVFAVRGGGTEFLSQCPPGSSLKILGPLGHGFPEMDGRVLIVGGGIGVPPLLFAAEKSKRGGTAVLGYSRAAAVILEHDFSEAGFDTAISTDDGSMGLHGTVLPLVEKELFSGGYAAVFSCGPLPMLRATAGAASAHGVPCYVSMEQRMACGIGACLGCAVSVRRGGVEKYLHVCSDGPVFDASEVFF